MSYAILTEDPVVSEAALFAARRYALAGRMNRYSGQSVICTIRAMASIIALTSPSREMVSSAWLHSTLQDAYTDYEELHTIFGASTAKLVAELSAIGVPDDIEEGSLSRLNVQRIKTASSQVKTLLLAKLYQLAHHTQQAGVTLFHNYLTWLKNFLPHLSGAEEQLVCKVAGFIEQHHLDDSRLTAS